MFNERTIILERLNIVALLTNRIPLDKFISSIWVAKVICHVICLLYGSNCQIY